MPIGTHASIRPAQSKSLPEAIKNRLIFELFFLLACSRRRRALLIEQPEPRRSGLYWAGPSWLDSIN